MTKAFLTAGALVALSLAMQEAVGQPVDPMAEMKAVKLKRVDERPGKKPADKLAAPIPAGHSQPVLPQAAEEPEAVQPGYGLAGLLPNGSVSFTTGNAPRPAAAPPASAPPPQQQPAPAQHSSGPFSLFSGIMSRFR